MVTVINPQLRLWNGHGGSSCKETMICIGFKHETHNLSTQSPRPAAREAEYSTREPLPYKSDGFTGGKVVIQLNIVNWDK